jgi:hypothetical protein
MVPPELTSCTWLAVQTHDVASVLARLARVRGKHTWLHKALQQRQHWVLVEDTDWIFLFSPNSSAFPPAGFDPGNTSRWGDVCWFSLQEEALAARRYRKGALVRRVERLGQGPLVQEGRPGQKREPPLAPFGPEAVLGLAEAWHCDPRPLLHGKTRAWLLEERHVRARVPPPRPVWDPGELASPFAWVLLAILAGAALYGWTHKERPHKVPSVFVGTRLPCQERYSCEMCTSCESSGQGVCVSQRQACERHEDCSALSACFVRCGEARMQQFRDLKGQIPPEGFQLDFTCDVDCIEAHPEGSAVFRAWKTCTSCVSCADLCAWQVQLGVGEEALADCAVSREDTEPPLGR